MDNMNQGYKVCPNCNQYVDTNVSYCENCNYVFYQQPTQNQQGFQQMQHQQMQYQQMPQGYSNQNQQLYYGNQGYKQSQVGFVFGLISAICIIVAMFLPYISVSAFGVTESMVLFEESEDAYIIIGVAVLGLILVMCKKPVGVLVMGVISSFLTIWEYLANKNELEEEAGYLSSLFEWEAGMYLSVIGSLVLLISGVIMITENKK